MPRRITRQILTLALAIVFGFTLSAPAQRYLGGIQGEVTDSTGGKVVGATVVAEEVSTHFKTTGISNEAGTYNFPALNPGTYKVSVTSSGFKTENRDDVVITAGGVQVIDFPLSPGAASETVDVTASNTLLDAGSANIATTLGTKEVTDLPNVGRNPFVLATLAAGVTTGAYMQSKSSQFTQPFSGVSVQILSDGNGGHNRLTLDGIPDDPAERFSGASYTGFVPSPEAVQEVKVQTSVFDAQIGHGNGTVTNTVIRSGNNKIHGAAYYAFQNTYINANTYEKVPNQNGALNPASPTHRNNDQLSQTGLVIDGPVLIPHVYDGRDKTFFLFAFERYASHTAINYNARVPSAAERAGDFSGLCTGGFNGAGLCQAGVQLYDPTSPVDANGNRTVFFPDNNIASRINAAGAALVGYLPLPNVAGAPITSQANYISNQTSYPSTYPSFIGRIDQAFGSKNKLNAIMFRSGLTQKYPLQGFPKGVGPTGYGYSVYRNNRGGSIDDVHQFSSSMVLDSRFGLIYHPFGLTYPGNSGFDLSSIGIANNSLPYSTFPGFTASDATYNNSNAVYAGLAPGAGGQISEDTTGSLEEILTKTFGKHTVRFGFEGNLIRYNVQNPQSGFGAFAFDRRFTQKNSINATVGSDASSGDPIASLLLGDFSSASFNNSAAYALQQIYMAPFVQDDWRVNSKLTLNLGVRWDYESPFTERYNKQVSNFCTTCASPLQASVVGLNLKGGLQFASASNRLPYSRDLNNFQPRIGAAYQATPTTVARAGFGIIYFNTLETPIGTGFSQTTSYNNYTTSAPTNSLTNPFPSGVSTPTGSSLGLATALGQSISFIDPNHVQPKSAQYSLSVQQQFFGSLALQVAYVGDRPTRLEVNHNINVLPQTYYNQGSAEVTYLNAAVANPLAGKFTGTTSLNNATIARNLLLLPYPEFGSVTEQYSSIGSAPYNSLQVQVTRPMRNHFSLQGNFTWSKTMLRNGYVNAFGANPNLYSVQDANATLVGNIFGTLELPKFAARSYYERLLVGGWQLNSVLRAQNGSLISAPGSVDIIGNPRQPNPTYSRYFNTCYQNTSGVNVQSTSSNPACDSLSPTPAYRQRLAYTIQNNSTVLNIRQRIHPLVDASLFKVFAIREGMSFEIRGEFFNVLNTPNFGGPNTSIGNSAFGSVTLTQANDARIGQLTGRINF
ncbi:hypothetical protein HDF16_001522 [Granulicella aggregans]|uniref:TonB-dependent transporter Oar-like beta-barrel domain-containing protein n=1 Tax=Granulicella aggregans TaxID=474949 RepID=A0A7W8E2S1_9BACT|nr:hypothetical protein [Granulicella aggregans]